MQPRQTMGRRGRSLGRENEGTAPPRRAVEIAASSVDEAVRLALQQLNLNYDEVEIEVLEDPTIHDVDEALVRVSPRPARPAVSGNVRESAPPGNQREPEPDDEHETWGNVDDNAA